MRRRTFFGLAAAAAANAAEEFPRRTPWYEAPLFGLSGQIKAPVKIAKIEVLVQGKTMLLRATSSDGAVGLVRTKEIEDFLPILTQRVIPFFVGKDARELERLLDEVYIAHYKIAGQPFWSPVASVEQAIWDLLGRVAGKSVADLLGGPKREEIPVYLSGSARDLSAEDEADLYIRGLQETGAQAVKFKIGGRMGRNVDVYPGRTRKMLERARKAMPANTVIYVDANGGYDASAGIEMAKWLHKEMRVEFFEEPCPWEEVSETKAVADAVEIPIAGGECDSTLWKFQDMITRRVVDIVQPDLNYCGGIVRAARVAKMAERVGMKIVPHNTQIDAAGAKILHFAAAIPNCGPYMEFPHRGLPKPSSWYTPNFRIVNGRVAVPKGPGLGVDFDGEYLKKMTVVGA